MALGQNTYIAAINARSGAVLRDATPAEATRFLAQHTLDCLCNPLREGDIVLDTRSRIPPEGPRPSDWW